MIFLQVPFQLVRLLQVCRPLDVLDDEALLARVHNLRGGVDHLPRVVNIYLTPESLDFDLLVLDLGVGLNASRAN